MRPLPLPATSLAAPLPQVHVLPRKGHVVALAREEDRRDEAMKPVAFLSRGFQWLLDHSLTMYFLLETPLNPEPPNPKP